ncbi:hypothetical protein BCV69DRAFT_280834 [Microstroma glucosiphilum]|uniref:Uncharacterized protein n=1 Tax=Pseudomicrostroma glucosiphilum TaxID=1684307 RepID=A0A316UDI3_9BASI|nr:hypothetical protein BCV69DRAFT_280834 [Pseudomicrostroma glucosiphilum]PWN23222.1 hypothetical protein BCV69DRAFT_280834 [Pseudomicrostroma glucosiphilum]
MPSQIQSTRADSPDSFGSRAGSGPLNGLTSSYPLPDGSFCFLSSTYRSPIPLPSSSPPETRARSAASSSASTGYGSWQLRAARIVGAHTAWFEGKWEGLVLKDLSLKNNCTTWSAFEEKVLQFWRSSEISFGASKQQTPETCSVLYVMVGVDPDSWIRLKLSSIAAQDALLLSTSLCMELSRTCDLLRSHLDTKQAQLDHSRSLAGVAPPPPSQVSSSLVNPGRIKRKHIDDGGFEDDDDDAAELEPTQPEEHSKNVAKAVMIAQAGAEEEDDVLSPIAAREGAAAAATKDVTSNGNVASAVPAAEGGEKVQEEAPGSDADDSDDSETQEDLLSTVVRKRHKT